MQFVIAALTGLAFGSFANVCVDRAPLGKPLTGRSQCDRCRRVLRWWELIPVASALLLRHRCRTCGARIPVRMTAVEFGSALLAVAVLGRDGGTLTFDGVIAFIGLLALAVLAIIDADHGIVPDAISVPAVGIVAILRFLAPDARSLTSLAFLVLAIAIGAGFFALQRACSRGRWVGDGDVRVGALMGAMLPLPFLAVALGVSYIIGGSVAAVLLATHRAARGAHLPLVPFLAIGTFVTVFWGEVILGFYGF